MEKEQAPKGLAKAPLTFVFVGIILILLAGFFVGPSDVGDIKNAKRSSAMQAAHAIGLSLYTYSLDHQGHYPDGRTSTEVFQQLVDGKYVIDTSLFYVPMPGKVRTLNHHLQPENICFDVTCCIDSSAPDSLPVVFLTGYKISYRAGAAAVPLIPFYGRTWIQWLESERFWRPFIVVWYKNLQGRDTAAVEDGSIPNFIPADFDLKGKTYRQLTP